jgi:acid stress-induced BolA-like protein IbaG/YrbA
MSKVRLQELLGKSLKLAHPVFHLDRIGGRFSGSIVSPSFAGKSDLERQQMIWDALGKEVGPESVQVVGTLLAYTPDEWDIDLAAESSNGARARVRLS